MSDCKNNESYFYGEHAEYYGDKMIFIYFITPF